MAIIPGVITVVLGRYGAIHEEDFPTLEEAARWVEAQEDRGNIFAAAVLRDGVTIFDHEHPPSRRRWVQLDPDTPWPGGRP